MIDSYDKLTIGKYNEVKAIVESGMNEYDAKLELVAVLADMEVEDVADLNISTFNRLLQCTSFLMQEPKERMVATCYKLGQYELDVLMDLTKMTVAQYIDYQTYLEDVDKNLVQMISVFLVPKGKTYGDGYDMLDLQRVIEGNMSIVDALSLSAFFLELSQALTKGTLICLKRKLKRMSWMTRDRQEKERLKEAIANLETVGNGLP